MRLSAEAQGADAGLVAKARAIHDRVITLDTHDDINPANFTRERNYTQRLDTQVNLPKMKRGRPRRRPSSSSTSARDDARRADRRLRRAPTTAAIEKFDAIHRLTEGDRAGPDRAGADRRRRAPDLPRAARRSRSSASRTAIRSAPTSRRVKEFYDRGARYMSLAHNGHNQLVRLEHRRARRRHGCTTA